MTFKQVPISFTQCLGCSAIWPYTPALPFSHRCVPEDTLLLNLYDCGAYKLRVVPSWG